jgi:NAD(P)-dependent dehydrogenase (short-subunit alcohol dehydrogenase family)
VDTDAADAEVVEQLMTQAADLGTLRVLVNNAGGWLPGPSIRRGGSGRDVSI